MALLATIFTASASAAAPVMGPDVSGWQHPNGAAIDWGKVRAAGNSFVIVKATEGDHYTNPYYASDVKAARAAKLIVGAYAFARPALPISTATAQAKFLVATLGNVRTAGTLPPILDLESSGGLSSADLVTWTQQFLETVRAATGRTPILYSYPYFWPSTMGSTAAFGRYPLWLASYNKAAPAPLAGWKAWTLWQYSSTVSVPGIKGASDMSRYAGTAAQLTALANGTKATPWQVTAPLAPRNVWATARGQAALVGWQPADDGGQLPSRYTVTASPGGARVSVAGTATSATIPRLAGGTSYTFTVAATNTAGTSRASTPSRVVAPGSVPSVPGQPTASVSAGSVTLTWPASTGGPTSYQVHRCSPAPCAPGSAAVATVKTTTFTDRGLTDGSQYVYSVSASNSWGASGNGPTVTVASASPAPAPAPASGPPPPVGTAISLALPRSVPLSGQPSRVFVRVTRVGTGAAMAGVPVLLAYVPRAGRVPSAQRLVTDKTGTAVAVLLPAITGQVNATIAESRELGASAASALLQVRPALTASLSAGRTKVGHGVLFGGATNPLLAGERVYRQGFYDGAWHTWSTTTVDRAGRFRFVIKPTVAAVNRYRVVIVGSRLHTITGSRYADLRVT
jgi:GH25 family lysozyme M1 (1,4-beta-N-acetylmuramidase)